MKKNFINLSRCMSVCSETIVKEVGLPTSTSEYLREGSEAIVELMAENDRLRTMLLDGITPDREADLVEKIAAALEESARQHRHNQARAALEAIQSI